MSAKRTADTSGFSIPLAEDWFAERRLALVVSAYPSFDDDEEEDEPTSPED
ncbi:hypothetical protein SAMN05444354_109231 [Stigmatella aurantiaca]|uniref:Uncharacterized protein n=1 Tax=Stigmatella aurantiaca TaxID=41 RepID=A0A1H7TZ21_STIAU|nr:hypothetical protein [Stigmatella aurantiaca]SEL89903.1 hypothetical protein SAMN05444354_109231 [Stigmatella aurantiaca]